MAKNTRSPQKRVKKVAHEELPEEVKVTEELLEGEKIVEEVLEENASFDEEENLINVKDSLLEPEVELKVETPKIEEVKVVPQKKSIGELSIAELRQYQRTGILPNK